MKQIKLFIASSLDGYIARTNGAIDWLFTDSDYGYNDFYASIDTVLVGRKTFETTLTFESDPFKGKECYVFSRGNSIQEREQVHGVSGDMVEFVESLKKQPGQDIWIVGGGELLREFLRHNLIDEIILFIHPIILGSGIPLFLQQETESHWQTLKTHQYESGLVEIHLQRK